MGDDDDAGLVEDRIERADELTLSRFFHGALSGWRGQKSRRLLNAAFRASPSRDASDVPVPGSGQPCGGPYPV
ncbi:hypothetical protein GCM10007036_32700 [Alsobacter metallidurans]|uniref:Uncharacterized protein n=1 Tax=Alsobacter metallidurans TaxID=340221 RepID=A0A917I9R8_9HYPH|nr:hypothetical protein GCM10007036_32700 [Alsobacter metallidurans]